MGQGFTVGEEGPVYKMFYKIFHKKILGNK